MPTVANATANRTLEMVLNEALDFRTMAPPTPLEVDWAEENLAGLPTTVQLVEGERAWHWRFEDGKYYRKAGEVWVDLELKQFGIDLYERSISKDLQFFRRLIERAKSGLFERGGWRRRTRADGSVFYVNTFSRLVDGPKLRAPLHFAAPCTEPGCIYTVHFGSEPDHDAEVIQGDGYRVFLTLIDPRPGDEWAVWIEKDDDVELSPARALAFARDIEWVAVAAQRLNADRNRAVSA